MKPRKPAGLTEARWVCLYAGLEDLRGSRRFARYLGVRCLLGVFRLLPGRFAVFLGTSLGKIGYWVLTRYRKATIENLGTAFPAADCVWTRTVARKCMEELGANVAYAARLPGAGKKGVAAEPHIEGFENLSGAVKDGRGFVVISAHLGCWELLPAYLASSGLEVSLVAERLAGRWENRLLRSERRKLGVGEVGEGVAQLKKAVRALRQGAVVVCPYDQDAGRAGCFVPFFGRPAFVPWLPLKLAQLSRSPLLPAYASREGGRHVLRFEPTIEVRSDDDLAGMAGECARKLESWIRERPAQWPWMHRRWRRSPNT
jgi:KDO2-lipid IV(A) lauroyltransferase